MAIKFLKVNQGNEAAQIKEAHLSLAKQSLQALLANKELGFFQIPQLKNLFADAANLGQQIRQEFDELVVVGIGGSSLGPRALHEIFYDDKSKHKMHFCDNTDSMALERLFKSLGELKKVAWVFISKSGTTLETLAAFDFVHQYYQKKGVKFIPQTFYVTELRSSPLYDFAKQQQRPILEVPLNVGGRFSVLTPVGMLPAAFLGLNIDQFRQGAESALLANDEVVKMAALSLQSFARQEWITLFWHYSSLMRYFGGWIQQLWAESLAKAHDRTGKVAPRVSTPLSAIGACDQHSILQQVMEGAKDKLVVFIRVSAAETSTELLQESVFPQHKYLLGKSFGQILGAEAEATSMALSEQGISNMVLQVPDLSERTIGFLFLYWELVVGTIGEAIHINAFDQPGVELGKRLAKQILNSSKMT